MERFDHEKLEVFNIALAFTGRAYVLAQEAPRGSGDLADQLRRASSSIVLNIAEGAGEYALGEKARFYRVAKRSATECAALVELYRRLELCDDSTADAARRERLRIVSMLVRLVKSVEGEGDRHRGGQRYG